MEIKWLRPALQDLLELAEFIASDNPAAASEQFLKIEKGVQKLKDNPKLGRPSALPGLRELVVSGTPFLVPYRIKDDQIEILAVFHCARDWRKRLQYRRS